MQYSITNVNAFIILVTIGFSFYPFVNNGPLKNQYNNLLDRNNSPVQLISQLKGYFNLNPVLALSLGITLFSFVGIPPLVGFFAKQMVLSAALDSGYVFLAFVAILTSVISAVYYLGVIGQIFFDDHEYVLDKNLQGTTFQGSVASVEPCTFRLKDIFLSSSLTLTVSVLTLALLLFIFTPQESISMASILALTLFNP